MTDSPPADRLLARHAERRRQGLATVSVLVGPSAADLWRRHAGPTIDLSPATTPTAASAAWLAGVCGTVPLLTLAVVDLGRRLGRPPGAVLGGRSAHDLEQMWAVVAATDDRDVVSAMRVVCTTTPADRWPAALAAALPGWRAVSAVDRLVGDARRPAVWVAGGLSTRAGPLAGLAAAAPRWPLGVGVTAAAFEAFRSAAGDGVADTLIVGGWVPAGDGTAAAAVASLASSRPAASGVTGARREDANDSAASPAIARPPDDPARSAAERALFAAVERRWPGLFALNRPLGFRFGRRAAEADLFAASLRLVVEVDGYHHFTAADGYRRDRRKDWLYQAHGYRYVRVLADDVHARLAEKVDEVGAAVSHCRGHPTEIA